MRARVAVISMTVAWLLACGGGEPLYVDPGAYGEVGGGGGIGAGSSSCEDACANLAACGIQERDACVAECGSVSEQQLIEFASTSCADLQAMAAGTYGEAAGGDGSACMREGTDDCPGTTMCCYDGRAAHKYEQGLCLEAGTCFMPR